MNPFQASDITIAFENRYVLQGELRVGGQGVVYRATRVRDEQGAQRNNQVALKLHLDPRQDVRVEREIAAARNLRHPALATLLEEGTVVVGGRVTRYIAWEFIDGEPLDSRISQGPINEHAVALIGRDVVAAIIAIWGRHIVHRDVAPKNIMVKRDGRAVLIDLGGARHLDNTTITAPGVTFGTPGYFSPEQYRAEHALTSASDVFALGIVLLECLLGYHPTRGDQHKLATSPTPVGALIPNVGRNFNETISNMLQIRAAFRPSPAELLERFTEILGES